jgi:3-phosphoshikimate 1-carboxyvinyltransferase
MTATTGVEFRVAPGGALRGELTLPGDKSVSHRALMLGAIGQGATEIRGFLDGEDTVATLTALRALGVPIERQGTHHVMVHGVGRHGLRAAAAALDLGNSGTSTRLLTGLLAGQSFDAVLIGDDSLSRRPMRRLIEPLQRMGARIDCSPAGTLPLTVHGAGTLHGIEYTLPVASAQLKSAILLAGLYADGPTTVIEPETTRDHTERMLAHFGRTVRRDGARISVEPGELHGSAIEVPGDLSSAAFFLVAGSIVPGSDLLLRGAGVNPTRAAVIDILRAMGARIDVLNSRQAGGEPIADLRVRAAPLRGIDIPAALVPIAIDEFPAILIAAACATGTTRLVNAAELRVKESDRIAAMADGLAALGIGNEPQADGITVQGGKPGGGTIDSRGDHRIAMAFAIAGLNAAAPVRCLDCANVNTSFPGFADAVRALGGSIEAGHGG